MAQRVRAARKPASVPHPAPMDGEFDETEAAAVDPAEAPGPGHNQPPAPTPPEPLSPEEVKAWLEHTCSELERQRRAIIEKGIDVLTKYRKIDSIELQGRVGDFRQKVIGAFRRVCKTNHEKEKRPFLEAGRTVDAFFKRLASGNHPDFPDPTPAEIEAQALPVFSRTIDGIDEALRQLQDAFAQAQRDESRRRAQIEADRKAAEAQAAIDAAAANLTVPAAQIATTAAAIAEKAAVHAAAPAAAHSRVTGEYGSTTSMRTTWTFEITSRPELYCAAAGMPGPSKLTEWRATLEEAMNILSSNLEAGGDVERLVRHVIGELGAYPRPEPAHAIYVQPHDVNIRRAVVSDRVRDPAIAGVHIFADESVR